MTFNLFKDTMIPHDACHNVLSYQCLEVLSSPPPKKNKTIILTILMNIKCIYLTSKIQICMLYCCVYKCTYNAC